ncbi:MAG: ribose 5-phosphate isomerase B [Candidatus Caldatribacteriota bacterium]|nr:ribose 5-phosphate isomerase B [Candidatus Caldatribacteriota bacterium]
MSDKTNFKIIQNVVSGLYSTTIPEKLQPDSNTAQVRIDGVVIGADHGGFEIKEIIRDYLRTIGYRVTDVGTFNKESVDYPDYALKVAKKVASGECERGIMIDGAGIGSSMACNKVKGIRATLCYDLKTINNSREHNNANVLTLGGPLHTPEELCEMVKVWLETKFAGGRHWKRVNKIMTIERGN